MTNQLDLRRLHSRYVFEGRLVLETALHVGTGRAVSPLTDSPILRDAADRPLIPGSSMKGAFRAAVERIVPNLGLRTCGLADGDPADPAEACPSRQGSILDADYRAVRDYRGRIIPREPTEDDADGQRAFEALERLGHRDWAGRIITDEDLL